MGSAFTHPLSPRLARLKSALAKLDPASAPRAAAPKPPLPEAPTRSRGGRRASRTRFSAHRESERSPRGIAEAESHEARRGNVEGGVVWGPLYRGSAMGFSHSRLRSPPPVRRLRG